MAFISDEERKRILAQMLSGQLMRPPPPMQATPASPLPGVPVETAIVAPQSEQAVAKPFDEFAGIRGLLPQRQFTPTGNKDVDAILARGAQTQQQNAQNYLNVIAQARMNPEEAGIIADQRARITKELAELDQDKKRAGWEALARAGFKMAQSNSPYFMQALASGMEAGIEGLNEAKLKRDEKKSRLQTADENARLAAIRGQQSAQDRAIAVYNAALAAGKSEQEARDAALRSAITEKTLPQQLEMADLEVKGKKADIKLTEARTVDALRGPVGRGGGDGDGTPGPRRMTATANQDIKQLEKAENEAVAEMTKARRAWIKAGRPGSGDKVTAMQDATTSMQSAMAARRGYLQRLGLPYSEKNIPAKAAYRREFGLERKPAQRRPAAAASSGLPEDVKLKYNL